MVQNLPFENRPLIEYLPNVLRDVQEFKVLTDVEEYEITKLWEYLKNALDDQFILSLTEYGLMRWEKILKIIPKFGSTMEERRTIILTRLKAQFPFRLHEMLNELCGPDNFKIELDAKHYTIRVRMELRDGIKADPVAHLLRRICPANLICEVTHDTLVSASIHYIGAILESKSYTFNVKKIYL